MNVKKFIDRKGLTIVCVFVIFILGPFVVFCEPHEVSQKEIEECRAFMKQSITESKELGIPLSELQEKILQSNYSDEEIEKRIIANRAEATENLRLVIESLPQPKMELPVTCASCRRVFQALITKQEDENTNPTTSCPYCGYNQDINRGYRAYLYDQNQKEKSDSQQRRTMVLQAVIGEAIASGQRRQEQFGQQIQNIISPPKPQTTKTRGTIKPVNAIGGPDPFGQSYSYEEQTTTR